MAGGDHKSSSVAGAQTTGEAWERERLNRQIRIAPGRVLQVMIKVSAYLFS